MVTNLFIFHAGDLYIPQNEYLKNMVKAHQKIDNVKATIGIKKVKNPRQYGVASLKKISGNLYDVTHVEEKPKNPKTEFALSGVNIFEPEIFDAINTTKPGVKGEIQLTDCIQKLITENYKVCATIMKPSELCIDIGTPEKLLFKHYLILIKQKFNLLLNNTMLNFKNVIWCK